MSNGRILRPNMLVYAVLTLWVDPSFEALYGLFVESHVIHQSLRLAITCSMDSLGRNVHWCQSSWMTLSTSPIRSFYPFANFLYALLLGCRAKNEMGMARVKLKVVVISLTGVKCWLIHPKRIYNFLCSMLVYTLFALCFVILRGIFMHFPKLNY
jgi:uncharacterized membrane protein